ncbi:uncharacterized protein METZ01_LOCUS118685, partial [marine metagenome]
NSPLSVCPHSPVGTQTEGQTRKVSIITLRYQNILVAKLDRGNLGLRSTLEAVELNKSSIDRIYHFVLSYSPTFPKYEIKNLKLSSSSFILDPFSGTGTTLVVAKKNGIRSMGIEANDFCHWISNVKLNWDVDVEEFRKLYRLIDNELNEKFSFFEKTYKTNKTLFSETIREFKERWNSRKLLLKDHISDLPLLKLLFLKELIISKKASSGVKDLLLCCFAAIVTPSSNIKFGPTPGRGKIKSDAKVRELFLSKCSDTADDLELVGKKHLLSEVILGDARDPSIYQERGGFDAIISSPPYPAEHEYTRHTRLEMILLDMVTENLDLRNIKKRMITGSTRNVYKGDNEAELVFHHAKINRVINDISKEVEKSRFREDGSIRELSGFEKLYSKTVAEYFGGMKTVLTNLLTALNEGGVVSLLVGDSRTYKLVHIPTAQILGEIAKEVGFKRVEIELWRNNVSTAHKLDLNENVLRLFK